MLPLQRAEFDPVAFMEHDRNRGRSILIHEGNALLQRLFQIIKRKPRVHRKECAISVHGLQHNVRRTAVPQLVAQDQKQRGGILALFNADRMSRPGERLQLLRLDQVTLQQKKILGRGILLVAIDNNLVREQRHDLRCRRKLAQPRHAAKRAQRPRNRNHLRDLFRSFNLRCADRGFRVRLRELPLEGLGRQSHARRKQDAYTYGDKTK